jgi:hypothetical protein
MMTYILVHGINLFRTDFPKSDLDGVVILNCIVSDRRDDFRCAQTWPSHLKQSYIHCEHRWMQAIRSCIVFSLLSLLSSLLSRARFDRSLNYNKKLSFVLQIVILPSRAVSLSERSSHLMRCMLDYTAMFSLQQFVNRMCFSKISSCTLFLCVRNHQVFIEHIHIQQYLMISIINNLEWKHNDMNTFLFSFWILFPNDHEAPFFQSCGGI